MTAHPVNCQCPACSALRKYPRPRHCVWCRKSHPGDYHQCQEPVSGNIEQVTGYGKDEQMWIANVGKTVSSTELERIVALAESHLNQLRHILKKELQTMSMADMLNNKRGPDNMLKGSDLPPDTKRVAITVKEVRPSPPEFTAPLIIDLKTPVFGKTAWAANKTNTKMIIKLFGPDETKLKGKTIKLDVISTHNPQNGEVVPSLIVAAKQQ